MMPHFLHNILMAIGEGLLVWIVVVSVACWILGIHI